MDRSHRPEGASDIGAPAECGAVHGKQRSFSSARAHGRVELIMRVDGAPPYWVRAFREEQHLRNISLGYGNASRRTNECDHLVRPMSVTIHAHIVYERATRMRVLGSRLVRPCGEADSCVHAGYVV